MTKPIVPDSRLVDIIRGVVAEHSTTTTRPDMTDEHILLQLCQMVEAECRARLPLWELEIDTDGLDYMRYRARPKQPKMKKVKSLCWRYEDDGDLTWRSAEDSFDLSDSWKRFPAGDIEGEVGDD